VSGGGYGRIFGVDFSAAVDAGRRIWLAGAQEDGGGLRVGACLRAEDLPGSGRELEKCLPALRGFIRGLGAVTMGMDFPFGLPRALVSERTWRDFVLTFPQRFPDASALRTHCRMAGSEPRRRTDREALTPFSPCNLRLFKQTYGGIAQVLQPLVKASAVRVLPMQRQSPDCPSLLETCPASTLKGLGVYRPYKGPGAERRRGRLRILQALEAAGLSLDSTGLPEVLLDDAAGDALDSVVAAFATWKAVTASSPAPWADDYALEGYVYSGLVKKSSRAAREQGARSAATRHIK
jgi:hypothetical protein